MAKCLCQKCRQKIIKPRKQSIYCYFPLKQRSKQLDPSKFKFSISIQTNNAINSSHCSSSWWLNLTIKEAWCILRKSNPERVFTKQEIISETEDTRLSSNKRNTRVTTAIWETCKRKQWTKSYILIFLGLIKELIVTKRQLCSISYSEKDT